MKSELPRRLPLAALAGWLLAACLLSPCAAHAQTPTAEQLKVFQSLPQEQRDAILQQMGVAGTGGNAARGAAQGSEIVVQRPGLMNGAETTGDGEAAGVPGTKLDRRIKGDEQLLIELALPAEGATQTITEITPDGRQVVRSQTTGSGQSARSADDQRRLTELRDRILRRNPYQLTRYGILQLPGFEPIPLGGLNAKEVQERLALDPALRDFTVAVTILRLEPQGLKALKPFGYEMFKGTANAFVPGTDIPVPNDYRVGPGDTMEVQLFGQKSQTLTLTVGRDGTVNFPELGPVGVGGMNFSAARSLLEGRVRKQIIGTQARVTLTELRSVRVLVLGDAERPGSYVVSSLSTVTNALFASGGVKPIGSLRKIEVKRDGKLLRRLDLYDVLLKGNTEDDIRLQSGDAVFVPPVGPTVSIDGEVKRPAIYELAKDATAEEAIALAGGFNAEADDRRVVIERVGDDGTRIASTVDLRHGDGRAVALRAGDVIRVQALRPLLANGVQVQGHVYRPGVYAYRPEMRLTDLIGSVDELKPRADIHYVLVRREDPTTRRLTAFSADLGAAVAAPGSRADIRLAARDVVTVFDLTSPRDAVLDPLLEEMSRQSSPAMPSSLVTVGGRVNAPGRYPLEPGMKISDLVRAGGGMQDAAYAANAELTRYYIVNGERRRADLQEVNLGAILAGDRGADLELQPYDVLSIKEMPEWGRVEQVELIGEVKFPGKYQIRRGETLRSVIDRAGGLSPLAFPEGAALTREDLKVREKEQLERLASRLQTDLTTLSIQASQTNPAAAQSLAAGQSLFEQLRQVRPVGRLVINLPKILASTTAGEGDVMLRNGDRLVVPRLAQEVSVLGEVQNPTSHLYRAGLTRDEAVALSGGPTSKADTRRTYVVRADGSVIAGSSRWFRSGDFGVRPGDTVVVPIDAERMRPLPLWTAVTQIVYNLAIAAAAVNSF